MQSARSKAGPHHVDASAYDAVYMIAQAIRDIKITGAKDTLQRDRDAIRDDLEHMTFTGVTGTTHFTLDHDAVLPFYVMEVNHGKANLLGSVLPGK